MKANKQLESKKEEILGMVSSLKTSNLEYEDKNIELEKKVLDLIQERDNALTVKVGLEDSSMKLGKMLSNSRSSNNKTRLGFSNKNIKTPIKLVFVRAA